MSGGEPGVGGNDAAVPAAPGRLWNRDFLLLWQGQLVSQLGNQAFLVAFMFWTMEATGSASLMGLLMMVSLLPMVLLGPVAGAFADRHSRKAIIVGSDLLRGALTVGLAAILLWRPADVEWGLAALFAVAAVSGVIGALFTPAITAVIPDLVPRERVAAANSLNQFSIQGSALVGQAAGGVAYRLLGAPALFLFDGLTFLFSGLSEMFLRVPRVATQRPPGMKRALAGYLHDTGEGLRFIRSRAGMLPFLLTAAGFNFLAMPVFVLLPFYVSDHLERDAGWYGFLLAAVGVGSLGGYAAAGALRLSGGRRAASIVAALAATASVVAVLGQVRQPVAALALFAAMGIFTGFINIQLLTLFQVTTPAEMRGRVMALVMAVSAAASPLGLALGGLLGDLTGKNLPLLLGGCGAGMLLVTLSAAVRRPVRRFLAWAED